MQLNAAAISALVRLTLTRPREAAARLIALDVPDDARWLGFVIVVVLSVLLGQASVLLMEDGEGMGGGLLFMAMFQTSILLGMVVAVQGVGRALGGRAVSLTPCCYWPGCSLSCWWCSLSRLSPWF